MRPCSLVGLMSSLDAQCIKSITAEYKMYWQELLEDLFNGYAMPPTPCPIPPAAGGGSPLDAKDWGRVGFGRGGVGAKCGFRGSRGKTIGGGREIPHAC